MNRSIYYCVVLWQRIFFKKKRNINLLVKSRKRALPWQSLFPLVFVFIGYKLFIKKIALKEIDFFVIGLFILGFNILVIGLCSLFSGLVVDTETSLGGFLGYFFMSMFDSLPFPIGKLLPALVTLLGLFLFTSKGPFWYFDKIGNFIFGFFDKDKKQDNNKNEKQEPQVNT